MATAPDLMFEHALTPLHGWLDPQSSLVFNAKISSNVTFTIPSGRVMHLNSVGEAETGIAGKAMALFNFPGAGHFDVSNPGTTAKGNFMHRAISSQGVMTFLVASGGFELETTEFDSNQTYNINDTLTAAVANTTAATGGVLTNNNATPYTHPVCGVVSRGTYKNEHDVDVLGFWTVYLPVA